MAQKTASTTKDPVDDAIRQLGQAVAMFDPLRFRAWSELGLTTTQLRVMFLMGEQPGVTAGELASRLGVTPPTISGIVDRLVRMRLVRREDDESDRRLVRNHLTEQGETACNRLEQGSEAFTRRILMEMDLADLKTLNAGMDAFIRASECVLKSEPDLATVSMPGA